MPNPAKFDPQRRNSRVGPVRLPAEGYQGAIPEWPLVELPSEAETTVWSRVWRSPQASAWARLGWQGPVARYCRLVAAVGDDFTNASLHGQVTALEDRLGLTPKAMRLMLWEVVEDELAEARGGDKRPDTRRRIRAVE